MTVTRTHLRFVCLASIVFAAAATAWLLACGGDPEVMVTVRRIHPGNVEEYLRGDIGVVRPPFARRYLVQAYRRMSGQPPIPTALRSAEFPGSVETPKEVEEWVLQRDALLGPRSPGSPTAVATVRNVGDYQFIDNCLKDAFATALRTLAARAERFGATSEQVRDWVRAQDVVFSNCGGEGLNLPETAPADADPLVKADREYQIASAHFYGGEFQEAARRFRAIAGDTRSPWRPYGRYLAARAAIREGTLSKDPSITVARLLAAEIDLKGVLDDASAKALHASARGLLQFIAIHVEPEKRFSELTALLATSREVPDQALIDYQLLFDRLVAVETTYAYAEVPNRQRVVASGPLTDWILAMQGSGPDATARAAAEWKRTKAVPWLVAFMWSAEAAHPDLKSAIDAAARVERSSPAFATVTYLRLRALHRQGNAAEVRRVLATLPSRPEPGFPAETMNLFAAARFRYAADFAELLANAPRTIVTPDPEAAGQPGFDDDAGVVFSERMPLARLIDAAQSPIFSDRLKLRIAAAAFTRAMMLGRTADAARVSPIVEQLAPAMRADVHRYMAAETPADRQVAMMLLLLRTPGLTVNVRGLDDWASYRLKEPSREFDDGLHRNWWCDAAGPAASDSQVVNDFWEDAAFPPFVTAAERAALKQELDAINTMEPMANFLANEAVKWARARPSDPDAAEALALAVRAARWGCGDDRTTRAGRTAFETLHKLFPKSEWARKTRYWYEHTGPRRGV
jgi:hypothetical protein